MVPGSGRVRGRAVAALGLWCTAHGVEYSMWHVVDVASVVCPSASDAGNYPPYKIGIDYTTTLDMNEPYIFTILRTSGNPVTIDFIVKDAAGRSVWSGNLDLKDQASSTRSVPSTCTCTGQRLPENLIGPYGANYGTACGDWDNAKCDILHGNDTGQWCCENWCYVGASCAGGALPSKYIPGAFYSTAPCEAADLSTCRWEAADPCKCLHRGNFFDTRMRAKFSPDYGSACRQWDLYDCDENYDPDQLSEWCCANWCYVSPDCPTSIPSINPGMEEVLSWSQDACPQDALALSQCMYTTPVDTTAENFQKCRCLQETMPESLRATRDFPLAYGTKCGYHDAYDCERFNPGNTGIWCCLPWCWVDESCPDARPSTAWEGHFYSGFDCEDDANEIVAQCPWADDCQCQNNNDGLNRSGHGMGNYLLPADYGKTCKAWDFDHCVALWGPDSKISLWNTEGRNDWCCRPWCYVEETCPIASPSYVGTLYYLYETCDVTRPAYYQEDVATPAVDGVCVDITGPLAACACLGESPPPEVSPPTSNYGKYCDTWDAESCIGNKTDMWCCMPWCWVSEQCPDAEESTLWPGHFYSGAFSDLTCNTANFAEAIRTCKYSDACGCVGGNGGLPTTFGEDYGTYCNAWDSTNCRATWGPTSYYADLNYWAAAPATNDWCCDHWCYVSFACPLVSGRGMAGIAYAYASACAPSGVLYDDATDTCLSRRLSSESTGQSGNTQEQDGLGVESMPAAFTPGEALQSSLVSDVVMADEPLPPIQGSDGWWSCRRRRITTCGDLCCCEDTDSKYCRAGNAEMPGAYHWLDEEELDLLMQLLPSPKTGRRGKGAPTVSYSDVRRRAVPVRPTAAASRRRVAVNRASAAASAARRRGVGTVDAARRRTTSLNGKAYTSAGGGQAVNYGYTDRTKLQGNFGGRVPASTSYGYSGAGAYNSGYQPHVAMYSPGHTSQTTHVHYYGGGGYHSYYMTSPQNSERRRTRPTEWCFVPDGSPQAGEVMECVECYRLHGFCQSAGDCYRSAGCGYKLPAAVHRDDLMATGFVPSQFTPPLEVTVTRITGLGYGRADVCPTPDSVPKFGLDLYLTLTKQDRLGELGASCPRDTGFDCKPGAAPGDKGLVGCYGKEEQCNTQRICECQAEYCLEGTPGTNSAVCADPKKKVTSGALCRSTSMLRLVAVGVGIAWSALAGGLEGEKAQLNAK